MKIWDAFYGKRNISALSSESRLFLFFGWPAPVRRVRSLLPLPPKLERDCPDAAWRQMQRAIQNEGELPSPFYFKLPDGPRVRADGSADIKWLIDPNRKPKNGAKLFRALQHMRAGREMEAQLALQDALPFFGAVAYLEELRPWLAKHKKFLNRQAFSFCWNQLWDSPDPRLIQFSLWIFSFARLSYEQSLRRILPYLSRCEAFTAYCLNVMSAWEDAQALIFRTARLTKNYGRYAALYYLEASPEVQDWLIREAWKDSDLPCNFAYLCVTKGKLAARLEQMQITGEDFIGAGRLLEHMMRENAPYKNLYHLENAAAILKNYLYHAQAWAQTLEDYQAIAMAWWTTQHYRYASEDSKREVEARSRALLSTQRCAQVVQDGLRQGKRRAFFIAWLLKWPYWDLALKWIEQDFWAHYHLADFLLPRNYYVEEIIAIFQKHLPLRAFRAIPNKPEPDFPRQEASINAFCYILDELRQHPGQGERLLIEGVKSGYTAHRELALSALEKWGKIPKEMKRKLCLAEWYGYQKDSPQMLQRLRRLSGKEKRPADTAGQKQPHEGAQKESSLRVLKTQKNPEKAP